MVFLLKIFFTSINPFFIPNLINWFPLAKKVELQIIITFLNFLVLSCMKLFAFQTLRPFLEKGLFLGNYNILSIKLFSLVPILGALYFFDLYSFNNDYHQLLFILYGWVDLFYFFFNDIQSLPVSDCLSNKDLLPPFPKEIINQLESLKGDEIITFEKKNSISRDLTVFIISASLIGIFYFFQ